MTEAEALRRIGELFGGHRDMPPAEVVASAQRYYNGCHRRGTDTPDGTGRGGHFWQSGGDGSTDPFFWVEEPVSSELRAALNALSRWGESTKVQPQRGEVREARGWEVQSEMVPGRDAPFKMSTKVSERQFRAVLALAGRVERRSDG